MLYLPNSSAEEHSDYDEVYTLTHYASIAHYQAVRSDPAALGGDGPDFQAMAAGVDALESLSLQSSTEFLGARCSAVHRSMRRPSPAPTVSQIEVGPPMVTLAKFRRTPWAQLYPAI